MEQIHLMPGQDRYVYFQDASGSRKLRYSYCSLRGTDVPLRQRHVGRSPAPLRGLAGHPRPLLSELNHPLYTGALLEKNSRLCYNYCAAAVYTRRRRAEFLQPDIRGRNAGKAPFYKSI